MKRIYIVFLIAILLNTSIVNAESKLEALQAIDKTEDDIKEMSDAGFGTSFVNDTLTEAKKALNASNYNLVLEKTQLISQRKSQAYNITDSIRALQLGMEDVENLGLNVTKSRELFNKTLVAFQNERYEESESLINQAYIELGNARAEATLVKTMIRATRENIISFVKENWSRMIIGGIALSVVGYIIFNRIMSIRTKNKIKSLEIENEVLTGLMKKAQSDLFQKKKISRETYEIKMKKYKERMLEIKETLPVLKARIEKK